MNYNPFSGVYNFLLRKSLVEKYLVHRKLMGCEWTLILLSDGASGVLTECGVDGKEKLVNVHMSLS